jgi:hypothetical protein
MKRAGWLFAAASGAALLILLAWVTDGGNWFPGSRPDWPRSNDKVLRRIRSGDGVLDAFLVMRESDALSADVVKLFVAPAGKNWWEGEMLMLGRRFSLMDQPFWVQNNWLCLIASQDGVEEQRNRIWMADRDLRFMIRPTLAACEEMAAQSLRSEV